MVVRTHHVVGAGLRGGIGAVGRIGRLLGERRIIWPERAVHLVGRHMQEAERRIATRRFPISARLFQQRPRAKDIGLHEFRRALDRAVDVALGREVHDGARAVSGQQLAHELPVADVALHEAVALVAAHGIHIAQIARIGELVEIDERLPGFTNRGDDVVGADKTGAAGDEQHGRDYRELRSWTRCSHRPRKSAARMPCSWCSVVFTRPMPVVTIHAAVAAPQKIHSSSLAAAPGR